MPFLLLTRAYSAPPVSVRACGHGEYDEDPTWNTPEGLCAAMLLVDQMSRNAFRGTAEAFTFDDQVS